MTRSMKPYAVCAALVLALGVRASTYAADVYNACSKDKNSKVRSSSVLANATPVCHPGETPRTWNQEGPPGFSSCAPEEATATCQPNTFAVLNLTCSSGKTAVGASAIWHTPFDAADNGPFYILPRSQFMWTVVPYNHTGTAQDYRFFLQCCS